MTVNASPAEQTWTSRCDLTPVERRHQVRYAGSMSVQAAAVSGLREQVHDAARRARVAARELATWSTDTKNSALHAAADNLLRDAGAILAANAEDLAAAKAAGTPEAMLDRLALNPNRIDGIAAGLRQVAGLPDPIGEVLRGQHPAQRSAAASAARSARCGRHRLRGQAQCHRRRVRADAEVRQRGAACGAVRRRRGPMRRWCRSLRAALDIENRNVDAVQLLPSEDRASVTHLIQARGLVDVVIPRGGAGLIDAVVRDAMVPTIETGVGNCHVYVHESADLEVAENILLNAKTRRPSVCNAAESLLIDRSIAEQAVPRLTKALQDAGVTVHAEPTRGGVARRVPVDGHRHGGGRRPRRRDRAHQRVRHRAHRGHRHHQSRCGPTLQRAGRCSSGDGQRVDGVHRRRAVRFRRRDRHLHPEAARPRTDGPARIDIDQVDCVGRRPHPPGYKEHM